MVVSWRGFARLNPGQTWLPAISRQDDGLMLHWAVTPVTAFTWRKA
jgi:hypothetical protein